jgi:hypothetical protein
VRDTEFKSTRVFEAEPTLRRKLLEKFWEFVHPILTNWYWTNRPSAAFNLHELDFDIVKAIRNPALAETLTQVQCSELNSIREYKNPAYFKFLPPKPQEVVLTQEAKYVG